MVLGILAVLSLTIVAAAVTWHLTTPDPDPEVTNPPAPADKRVSKAAPKAPPPSASMPTASPTTAPPPAPPPAPSTAAPATPAPTTLAGCYAELLPGDAFGGREPDLKESCDEESAYAAALVLKTDVVRTGGPHQVTDAMREWSRLGWYETAAFALMRAHCCPDAGALKTPERFSRCRMEEALAYLSNALDDDGERETAIDDFAKAARCVALAGGGGTFGQPGVPSEVGRISLERIIERLEKARSR